MKKPEGQELFRRLAVKADVVLHNMRDAAALKLGCDEASLRKVNPRLIYCSISGYGVTGPMAGQRAYDPIMQARSGFASMQANDDAARPKMIRTIIADNATALTTAQAITAALFKRERTGKGEHVRVAMLDATVAFLWPEAFARQTMM